MTPADRFHVGNVHVGNGFALKSEGCLLPSFFQPTLSTASTSVLNMSQSSSETPSVRECNSVRDDGVRRTLQDIIEAIPLPRECDANVLNDAEYFGTTDSLREDPKNQLRGLNWSNRPTSKSKTVPMNIDIPGSTDPYAGLHASGGRQPNHRMMRGSFSEDPMKQLRGPNFGNHPVRKSRPVPMNIEIHDSTDACAGLYTPGSRQSNRHMMRGAFSRKEARDFDVDGQGDAKWSTAEYPSPNPMNQLVRTPQSSTDFSAGLYAPDSNQPNHRMIPGSHKDEREFDVDGQDDAQWSGTANSPCLTPMNRFRRPSLNNPVRTPQSSTDSSARQPNHRMFRGAFPHKAHLITEHHDSDVHPTGSQCEDWTYHGRNSPGMQQNGYATTKRQFAHANVSINNPACTSLDHSLARGPFPDQDSPDLENRPCAKKCFRQIRPPPGLELDQEDDILAGIACHLRPPCPSPATRSPSAASYATSPGSPLEYYRSLGNAVSARLVVGTETA